MSFDYLGANLWPENADNNVDNPVTTGPKMNPQKKTITPPTPHEPNLLEQIPNTGGPRKTDSPESGASVVKNSFLNVFDF